MHSYLPYVDAAGPHVLDFATILAQLQADYLSIFGIDAYLGNDAQDMQWMAVNARAIADGHSAFLASYNSFSPATSQGNGLSSVVKINGLARALPSPSTCTVTITGIANTTITNGLVTDTNGKVWALPATVTIPTGGSIDVTATCQTAGAIAAGTASLTKIKTPVYGWQSVTNANAATLGNPVETDAALRNRQSVSTAAPSVTIFEGVMASIAGVLGVTRSRGYLNDTVNVDGNSIPARSASLFVEGGDSALIAQTIAQKLTPGLPTNGAIANTIVYASGSSRSINFSRPTNAVIHVALTVKALAGWSVSTEDVIAQAVSDYINTLRIGDPVRYFDVAVPAKLLGNPLASTFAVTAMTLAKNAGGASAADVAIAYNEAPFGDPANVAFTVT